MERKKELSILCGFCVECSTNLIHIVTHDNESSSGNVEADLLAVV